MKKLTPQEKRAQALIMPDELSGYLADNVKEMIAIEKECGVSAYGIRINKDIMAATIVFIVQYDEAEKDLLKHLRKMKPKHPLYGIPYEIMRTVPASSLSL